MRRTFWLLLAATLSALMLALVGQLTLSGSKARAQGTPTGPAAACGRTMANLVALLIRDYDFEPQAVPGGADYCALLENEVNLFIEQAILKEAEGLPAESTGAFAYIDFAARQYVGVMPRGTRFLAVARNALPGSQMIFVVGDQFSVFVDYTFTTLPVDQFGTLPDYREYSGSIAVLCEANWCRTPGPAPTQSR